MNAQRSGFFCHVLSPVISWWLGKEESLQYMEGFHGSGLKVVHIFLLMFHWLELSHMATPDCKGGREMWSSAS